MGSGMGLNGDDQGVARGLVSELTCILMVPGLWDGPLVTLNIDSLHPVAVNGHTCIHIWCGNPFGSEGPCPWEVVLGLLPSQGFMGTVGHRACSA